jgi:hypothetical protein
MNIKLLSLIVTVAAVIFLSSCNWSLKSISGGDPQFYPIRQNLKWGFMNKRGEVVIQPQFEIVMPFSEGLAVACISREKCGYIDETGKFIVNPQFEIGARFSEGVAAVITGGKVGYIDKTGKYVINPQFESVGGREGAGTSNFSEGLAMAKVGGKIGFVDKKGQIVVNPQFDDALPFFEGLAAARMGDKWGFVDKEGKIAINPQFEDAQPFSGGLAAVLMGKQYGYIDKTGKIIINPQFDSAQPFSSEGLAAVFLDQKMGLIDREGTYAVNPQFGRSGVLGGGVRLALLVTNEIGRLSISEGLLAVRVGENQGSFGYADKTGKIVINPQFNEAFPFFGGLALVNTTGGPDGLAWIDKEGKYVWRETKENQQTAANANPKKPANVSTPTPMASSPEKTGRLTTDSNIRSEANKDSASLGIHFKGAKVRILDETSFTKDDGEVATWFKIRVYEYGCSADTSLGCGKNNSNDADEGWVNSKNVLLD